jgi:casein kinase II subunit alpha
MSSNVFFNFLIKKVFEKFGDMSIKDLIMSKKKYSKQNIRHIMKQLLESLAVVHDSGLIHRDIKPGNIIVDSNTYDSRLIDFGLAEFYIPGKEYNIRIATKPFKPPEILINYRKYFQSFDIWGAGNVLGCLVRDISFANL